MPTSMKRQHKYAFVNGSNVCKILGGLGETGMFVSNKIIGLKTWSILLLNGLFIDMDYLISVILRLFSTTK